MLLKGQTENFNTLMRAAAAGDLALMECTDKATGKKVAVICAVERDGESYNMVPLAKQFDGNPYEEVDPPSPEDLAADAKEIRQ